MAGPRSLAGNPQDDFSPGTLLGGVRKSLGLSVEQLAARLGVPARVVAELESDAPHHLPPSYNVSRIVRAWMGLAGLDSDLVLASMARFPPTPDGHSPRFPPIAAPQVERWPPAATGAVVRADPEADADPVADGRLASIARSLSGGSAGEVPGQVLLPADDEDDFADPQVLRDRLVEAGHRFRTAVRRLRHTLSPAAVLAGMRNVSVARPVRRLAAVALAMAALGGTVGYTSVGATAVSSLPAPASRAVRSLSDFFVEQFAPVRDGHRWIEVADPRSRRADKLPVARQSD
ncbi:MAG: helix-turn-helix domain-containing protein [Hyphomicrobiaceae bacterium]